MRIKLLSAIFIISLIGSCRNSNKAETNQELNKQIPQTMKDSLPLNRSEEEWRKILTPEQYHVLREKGTERPFTGKYNLSTEKGMYVCAACGNELFTSAMKFDSHCGWPSFDKEITGEKIKTVRDTSHGMVRTEILCARCGSHLGHLFDDGPTETGMRYCVNSVSLDFKREK